MALRVNYVVRETASNLWRNLLLTLASMLTVAVSLSLVGSALLLRQGVDNATIQWKDGIEFSVYMNPEATPDQMASIERELERSQGVDVERYVFVDQDAAYDEFKTLFGNSPDMVENITPEVLPPSFRVVPTVDDSAAIKAMADRFTGRPGVREVALALDTVDTILRVGRAFQIGILVLAMALLFSAALLIFNTIRMAIYARRREIEVMKLVGATNWFIRVPFMLEGLVQGLVGAGVSFLAIWALQTGAQDAVRQVPLFSDFIVSASQVTSTGMLVLALGALIGAISAGVAVTRFLDV
jgi:cell division transport system permease protein